MYVYVYIYIYILIYLCLRGGAKKVATPTPQGYIAMLAVEKELRGKRIGSQLVQLCLSRMKRLGSTRTPPNAELAGVQLSRNEHRSGEVKRGQTQPEWVQVYALLMK